MSEQITELRGRVESDVTGLSSEVLDLRVEDDEDYQIAGEYLVSVKRMVKKVESLFGDPIKQAHAAHKAIVAAKKEVLNPLERAEGHLKRQIASYSDELRRRRLEEEARLQAEAKRQAEEAAIAKAEKLHEQGREDEAESALVNVSVPAVSVGDAPPKVDGMNTREVWDFEVEDPDKVPDEYWVLDESKIRGVVRSLGGDARIPGVSIYKRTVVVAGRS